MTDDLLAGTQSTNREIEILSNATGSCVTHIASYALFLFKVINCLYDLHLRSCVNVLAMCVMPCY